MLNFYNRKNAPACAVALPIVLGILLGLCGCGEPNPNDDIPTLVLSPASPVVKDSSATLTFTVTLEFAVASPVTVDYATHNDVNFSPPIPGLDVASPGVDYATMSGTLTFAPGETVKTIAVPILNTGSAGSDKYFKMVLSNVVGHPVEQLGSVSSVIATILNSHQSFYKLDVSANSFPPASGSVSLNPPGGTYAPGTVVTVTAVPGAQGIFAEWERSGYRGVDVPAGNPTTIVMDSNKSFGAVFNVAGTWTLTVNNIGAGSGTVSMNAPGPYLNNAGVNLTATPAPGSIFVGWTSTAALDPAVASYSTVQIFNIDSTKNPPPLFPHVVVTAQFDLAPAADFTLTTNTTGTGSGIVQVHPVGPTYAPGTVVTIGAVPAAGSTFAGWSGALSGTVNSQSLTMNSNKTATATFSKSTSNGPGDVNGDKMVNISDLTIVTSHFGQTSASAGWDARADTNGDGVVNINDLTTVTSNFGKSYP